MTSQSETIDVREAADLLRCDEQRVMQLIRQGDLPAAKIGRGWVILRPLLIEWLREKSLNSASEIARQREPETRKARRSRPISAADMSF